MVGHLNGRMRTVAVAALTLAVACSGDNPAAPVTGPGLTGLVVSQPVPASAYAAAAASAGGASDSLVYVSLGPGAVVEGTGAAVTNLRTGVTIGALLRSGGFDPAPLPAVAGDSVEVVVRDHAGAVVAASRTRVRPSQPPVIVRTDPPPHKTDTPLNAIMAVVFSEPVDPASITGSTLALQRVGDTVSVAASVLVAPGRPFEADLVPAAPLQPSTAYQLTVGGIRDLAQQPLATPVIVPFTTGTTTSDTTRLDTTRVDTTGLTVTLAAPLSRLRIQRTVSLSATLRDAAGNPVSDTFTWSSSDTAVATVAPFDHSFTGGPTHERFVTGRSTGTATITATSATGKSGTFQLTVADPPVASVTLTTESFLPGLVGDSVALQAALRSSPTDSDILGTAVTWSSSDTTVARVVRVCVPQCDLLLPPADTHYAALIGEGEGKVLVTATAGGFTDTVSVTIDAPAPMTILGPFSPTAINDAGVVVGYQVDAGNTFHAVAWEAGALRTLPGLAGQVWSVANGVNASGQIVGSSGGHAVLWDGGTITDLGFGAAHDINDTGWVVGTTFADSTGCPCHAFVWHAGVMTDLGAQSGFAYSVAQAINTAGQIAGFMEDTTDHAVLWSAGSATIIDYPGYPRSEAIGVDDAGHVLVQALGPGYGAWYLWQNGTSTGLPISGDGAGVNAAGLVVSDAHYAGMEGDCCYRPLAWQAGAVRDLGAPRDTSALGWGRLDATALAANGMGQVVGLLIQPNGTPLAVMWTIPGGPFPAARLSTLRRSAARR